ncbi:MAG: hypothetical protein JST68_12680 [Bacteroidetes bacterium]|nr:hypothetical protein [Bacteroidota bacterium]
MKKIILFFVLSVFSLSLFATETPRKKSAPQVYFIMSNGKLIEINKGQHKRVRKDVTLMNETTIHPNGTIDAGSGQSLQLHEGEYMTLDGKIRKVKNRPRHQQAK